MARNDVQLILRGVAGLELEATNKAAGALSICICVLATFRADYCRVFCSPNTAMLQTSLDLEGMPCSDRGFKRT